MNRAKKTEVKIMEVQSERDNNEEEREQSNQPESREKKTKKKEGTIEELG